MSRKTTAMRNAFVALGFGTASDYVGDSVAEVLKELAVASGAADSVDDIPTNSSAGVLEYIAANAPAPTQETGK